MNPFKDIPCKACGSASLRLEYRQELVAKPIGSWSLAGVQDKLSCTEMQWPYCVCDSCGKLSRGTL